MLVWGMSGVIHKWGRRREAYSPLLMRARWAKRGYTAQRVSVPLTGSPIQEILSSQPQKEKGIGLVSSIPKFVVPRAGLEPAREFSLPPQDSVSTSSTTSAQTRLLSHSAGNGKCFFHLGGLALQSRCGYSFKPDGVRHGRNRTKISA